MGVRDTEGLGVGGGEGVGDPPVGPAERVAGERGVALPAVGVGVGRWEGAGVGEVEGQGEGERGEEGVGEGVEEVEGQGEGTLRPLDVPRAPLKGPYLR